MKLELRELLSADDMYKISKIVEMIGEEIIDCIYGKTTEDVVSLTFRYNNHRDAIGIYGINAEFLLIAKNKNKPVIFRWNPLDTTGKFDSKAFDEELNRVFVVDTLEE